MTGQPTLTQAQLDHAVDRAAMNAMQSLPVPVVSYLVEARLYVKMREHVSLALLPAMAQFLTENP